MLVAALAAVAACVLLYIWQLNQSDLASEAIDNEDCNSCSARHQSLGRLRDALGSDRTDGE